MVSHGTRTSKEHWNSWYQATFLNFGRVPGSHSNGLSHEQPTAASHSSTYFPGSGKATQNQKIGMQGTCWTTDTRGDGVTDHYGGRSSRHCLHSQPVGLSGLICRRHQTMPLSTFLPLYHYIPRTYMFILFTPRGANMARTIYPHYVYHSILDFLRFLTEWRPWRTRYQDWIQTFLHSFPTFFSVHIPSALRLDSLVWVWWAYLISSSN